MDTASSTVDALRFARALIRIAPRKAAETALVTLGLGVTEGIGLLLLVPLLQLVGVEAQRGSLARVVDVIGRLFSAVGLQPSLALVLVFYVAVVGLQALLQRRQSMLNAALQEDIVSAVRERVYRAIAGAKWTFIARSRSADFSHVLTNEIDRIGVAAYFVVDLAVMVVMSLVYAGLALRVSPAITGLVVVSGAVLGLGMRRTIRQARETGERYSESRTSLHSAVSEQLASLKLARSYGAEPRHALEFARASRAASRVALISTGSHAALRQYFSIASAIVLAVIVYVSHAALNVSPAQLLLLLFLFARLVPRLTGLYEKSQMLATLLPAYAAAEDIERRCLAAAEPIATGAVGIDFADRIQFEAVTFDYDDDQASPALAGLTLSIEAGATTAIVGPSGAGKSTIADMLLGLLEPARGRMLVDGVALTAAHLDPWRDQIGYVAQDPWLFHDTVRANLLWARPDATEAELWSALESAAAGDFVRTLPRGLDTIIGDRGVRMSGGERQRLSLARALVRRPRLLILDEATSSLDADNVARIQRAIEALHHKTTIVIITHRLSTLRRADAIHVVERGRLVETGTWDQLMARPAGRFRALSHEQDADAAAQRADVPRIKAAR